MLNIKYINEEFINKIADSILIDHDLSEDEIHEIQLQPQIFQPDRKSHVEDIDKEVEKNVILEFYDNKYWVISYNSFGKFYFNLFFKNNKCIIEFEEVKPSYPNSLYPEEIQIKLLKRLTRNYPELHEKFSNINELTLQHSTIVNKDTLSAISLHLRNPEQKYIDPLSVDSKKVNFPRTPNGNNIMNFLREFAKNFCSEKDIKFDKGKTKININNNHFSISFKLLINPSSELVSEPLVSKLDLGKESRE